MAESPPGKWVIGFKDGILPIQEIGLDVPKEAAIDGVALSVELKQPYRVMSRGINIGGDVALPRRVRVSSVEIAGSVIMTFLTPDKRTINQWVIDNNTIEFMIVPPRSDQIILTLRLFGSVKLSSVLIEVEEVPIQTAVDWMLVQFNNPSLRRRKGYLEHYIEYLLESGYDLRVPGFLEFLFSLERYQDIVKIVGNASEPRGAWELRNLAKICDIIERPGDVRKRLEELGIREYRVSLINSGLGDILTTGNLSSYLCERLGLNYVGVYRTYRGRTRRGYYDETFLNMSEPSTHPRTLFIDFDDNAQSIDDLMRSLDMAAPGQYDELCLVPATPNSFSTSLKHSRLVCTEFINNQFNRYIKAKNAIMRADHEGRTVLIHARLGDVAPIPIGNWCVSLYDLLKGNRSEGLVSIDSGSNALTLRSLSNIRSLRDFVQHLRATDSSLRIVFISDGFDLTRNLLGNPDLQDRIISCLPGLTIQGLEASIKEIEEDIASLPFDHIQMGEKTIEDFNNSVALILSSDVVISTARSFVFNCLANFKFGDSPQHFFSPVIGGYFDVLRTKGCTIHQFTEFGKAREEVSKCIAELRDSREGVLNITDQCIAYPIGPEGPALSFAGLGNGPSPGAVEEGKPVKIEESNRLFIDLNDPHKLSTIELVMRGPEAVDTSHFFIDASMDGEVWNRLFFCDFDRECISVDVTGTAARYIRISKEGPGNLLIGEWSIFSKGVC